MFAQKNKNTYALSGKPERVFKILPLYFQKPEFDGFLAL